MRIAVLIASLAVPALLLAGCGDGATTSGPSGGEKPVVYTTFYPTTYFAQRIGGDLIEVVCPVPEDEDAIFWQPDDATLAAYQGADLVITNGAQFEKWVVTASLLESRVVDTAESFESEFVTFEDAVRHSHGPSGEHAHEGVDGHTWLDPHNAKRQAKAIFTRLVRLLPDREKKLEANFQALEKDLDGLHAELMRLKRNYRGEAIYTSHPAYNYLAKQYEWSLVNLNLDPEQMPDDETIEAIRKSLAEKPARYILWESSPTAEIEGRFKDDLGLTSVEFSPCELLGKAELDAGEDYLTVMHRNLRNLQPVLTP
jgi:zinc transport system substrate-binding protein